MIVTYWKGVFVVDKAETPPERSALKKAGFILHEPTICSMHKSCKACRANIGSRYWSDKVTSATRLRSHCNERALGAMRDHLDKLAQSRAVTSDIAVPCPPDLELKPYQRAGVAYILSHKDTYLGDDMGLGKDQPLDAKILTPSGWTTMGKIKKGDLVTGSNSDSYTVEGVYPQGKQKVYRVTLLDGSSTECGGDHLWEVRLGTEPLTMIMSTLQMKQTRYRFPGGRYAFTVPKFYQKTKTYRPRQVVSTIEFIGVKETQCIAVSSPDHLYVTDDRILTHNTVQAIGALNSLKTTNPKMNTLVLCPGNLDHNWQEEVQRWMAVHGPGDVPEIIIPTSSSFEVPRQDNLLVIVNYEKVIRDSLLGDSLKRVWDVLICDEAQALKNWSSKRTRAVLGEEGLMQRAHRTIFLSGTPIENYPKEIWTIAASICPAKFGNWSEFSERYCGIHREHGRVVDTGAANLAELQQRLRSSFMIRRLKKDVLKELPPKRRQLIVLGQSKVDWSKDPDFARWKEFYERDYESKLAALEAAKTEDDYKKAARKLEAFTGIAFNEMSDFRHRTAVAKLPACIEYVDKILESGIDKLVIFAHHQDVLATLAKHYGDVAVSLHGEIKKSDRWPLVKQFQEGSKRIFIGGLKAAGVGLNLFRASTVVFIEIDWNPATLTQAEDRLCRIGQKKMVHVIHLILEGTLDANIVRRVVEKQAVVDKALNFLPEHGMPKTVPRGSSTEQLELGM